jgi:dTDP-4-amino-4,6-dideoxygalactose transaminase
MSAGRGSKPPRPVELAVPSDPAATVRGGRPWPAWPPLGPRTADSVAAAVEAQRWTLSWPGGDSLERRFAQHFADYNRVPYAVPVDHGSSALVVALEALDVGPGDEVIVPTMTWVATATAVLRVGALPVLVDSEPGSGCVSVDAVEAALSERTRAVIAVHLGSSVAGLGSLLRLTRRNRIALIEDSAQATGAIWRGRHVGTLGELGTFSFQAGKVLACGEGGAVVTSDPALYRRAQQLRADARCYADPHARHPDDMELVEVGEVTGSNHCMSELHAALLLDQLPRLDEQHAHRELRASELEDGLATLGDLSAVPNSADVDRRSIYTYGIRFEPGAFGDAAVEVVGQALSTELERPVYPPDVPLHRSLLFRPATKRRFAAAWTETGRKRAIGRAYPGAEHFRSTTLLLHHSALLGTSDDVADILEALTKVRARCRATRAR